VRNVAFLLTAAAMLLIGASAQLHNSSKAQDERELRRIESETAKLEQQNDSSVTNPLADDWVYLGAKVLTKGNFQATVKRKFVANNGSNPYTIEKKEMRVDLFGDTAVVTYTKEYRPTHGQSAFTQIAADTTLSPLLRAQAGAMLATPDTNTTKFFDQENTDVFTRSPKGWQLRLTKTSPAPLKSNWPRGSG
jgi:hypothetical protein